jgi:hypothetical protein
MRMILAILLLVPHVALGDPGPTTRYLMNERASLFDIGMYRLQRQADIWASQVLDGLSVDATYYDWDKDLIIVDATVRRPNREEARAACRTFIQGFRLRLRAIGSVRFGGTPQAYSVNYLEYFFSHWSYRAKDEPADVQSSLQQRMELRCTGAWPLDDVAGVIEARATVDSFSEDTIFFAEPDAQQ